MTYAPGQPGAIDEAIERLRADGRAFEVMAERIAADVKASGQEAGAQDRENIAVLTREAAECRRIAQRLAARPVAQARDGDSEWFNIAPEQMQELHDRGFQVRRLDGARNGNGLTPAPTPGSGDAGA